MKSSTSEYNTCSIHQHPQLKVTSTTPLSVASTTAVAATAAAGSAAAPSQPQPSQPQQQPPQQQPKMLEIVGARPEVRRASLVSEIYSENQTLTFPGRNNKPKFSVVSALSSNLGEMGKEIPPLQGSLFVAAATLDRTSRYEGSFIIYKVQPTVR